MNSARKTDRPEGDEHWPENLSFLLRRTQWHFAARHAEVLAELGLTEHKYVLLDVVVGCGALSQVELGRKIYIDRTSIVDLVDSLEEDGLVVRNRSTSDRRVMLVSATPKGITAFDRAREKSRAAEYEFLEPLPESERDVMLRALEFLARSYSAQQ